MNSAISGICDALHRPYVDLNIEGLDDPQSVLIDTAFTGYLLLPKHLANRMGLYALGETMVRFTDQNVALAEYVICNLEWFGSSRPVQTIVFEYAEPLIGTALLRNERLEIDFRNGTVAIRHQS